MEIWIDGSVELPNVGEPVMIKLHNGEVISGYMKLDNQFNVFYFDNLPGQFTIAKYHYWQPITKKC